MEEKNPIQVADRLFAVMETLAATGPMGLLDLSKMLDLNKSTVHRVLNSLIYLGYVKQDPVTSKYSLTYKICRIANHVLDQIDLLSIAKPYLKDLSEKTGETVHLVEREEINGIYIDKVENSANAVRLVSKIGKSIPLYCSGVGKAMLSEMDENTVKKIWEKSRITALTEHTITDYDVFVKELEQIRARGYAIDDEENEIGVRCVAVSLPDPKGGKPRYALSISAPGIRMSNERIKELADMIQKTKDEILKAWR